MNLKNVHHQHGFTLIELMVVIVIISIVASLIVMNIDGLDHRKAMQAREILILDLKRILRESNDQSRIFALVVQPQTDVADFSYRFDEYIPPERDQNRSSSSQSMPSTQRDNGQVWQQATAEQVRRFDSGISFTVEAQDHEFAQAQNSDLIGQNAPQLIWLGNGEVKPASIQMYYQGKPLGDLIQVDYLGKVSDAQ